MQIDQVIIFDDNLNELRYRKLQAEQVIAALVRGNQLNPAGADGDFVRASTQRAEVLEWLDDQPNALLIGDLESGQGAFAGNVGGRLMRAVAQSAAHAEATRRVIWSRHTLIEVTEDSGRWAHAFALWHEGGAKHLLDAIKHALTPGVEPRVFPKSRTKDEMSDDLLMALESLVGAEHVQQGDELIASALVQRRPRDKINDDLKQIKGGRANVQQFITAVQEHKGTATDATAAVIDVFSQHARDDVHDKIRHQECDVALAYRPTIRANGDADYFGLTRLTEQEDLLVREFLREYGDLTRNLHGAAAGARGDVIDRIIGPPFGSPSPTYGQALADSGLGNADLAYALWTLADLKSNR